MSEIAQEVTKEVPSHPWAVSFLFVCCGVCCFTTLYNRQDIKVHAARRAQRVKMQELVQASAFAKADDELDRNFLEAEDPVGEAVPYRTKASDYKPPRV